MDSVTQIIEYYPEPEINRWILRVGKIRAERISKEAREIGTIVDGIVKNDIKTGKLIVPSFPENYFQLVFNCLNGWELFKKDHPGFIKSVKHIDRELVDEEDQIVGHPDMEIDDGVRRGIVDIKCAGAIRPRNWTQTAKYLHLTGHDIHTNKVFIAILRLDKITGLYEYKEIEDSLVIAYEVGVFNAFHKIYRHGMENREVMRRIMESEVLNIK